MMQKDELDQLLQRLQLENLELKREVNDYPSTLIANLRCLDGEAQDARVTAKSGR